MKKFYLPLLMLLALPTATMADDFIVEIDTDEDNVPISPYMYGRNGVPADDNEINLIHEAGIKFERMNNGNNCTKYNWRKKLTCHPDWYNNVYAIDWDANAQNVQQKLPDVQGMFGFQLSGKVAKSADYNFNDWEYNQSKWWDGCSKKMCGGGTFNADGSVAQLGDTSLYLQDWPADSTVAIYPYWEDKLGIDMSQFQYWSMDNEMEIWGATHSDVAPATYDDAFIEDMMQKYFAVAKAARAINPDIKLCGPCTSSEWFWFNLCGNTQPTYEGKTYCWLEYFIMRCALEEEKTGIRMIDIFDIHNYPEDSEEKDMLQTHRLYYDKDFSYPKANGLKRINGGWENNMSKEYILERCREWIVQYFGSENGIKFGIGEFNIKSSAPEMVQALSYASHIGEGCRNGMEYFTPWTWYKSMWEVVHLYSRYAKNINVKATSPNESMLSAYSSKNATGDSLTIIFVNRSNETTYTPTVRIAHTIFADASYPTYTLSNLKDEQTFKSHEENALQKSTVVLKGNTFTAALPPYSITAVTLGGGTSGVNDALANNSQVKAFPNPATDQLTISCDKEIADIEIINTEGVAVKRIEVSNTSAQISVSDLNAGVYTARVSTATGVEHCQVIIK